MTSKSMENLPLLLSVSDLVTIGFSTSMIYNKIFKDENLDVIQIGNKKMVQRDEFLKWLENHKITSDEKRK